MWVFCFFTNGKYRNECSAGEFDLIEEIKNLTFYCCCLCLQFVASFLNFRRSKILLAYTVSVSLSLLPLTHEKKKKTLKNSLATIFNRRLFAIISQQERPHNYTTTFSTHLYHSFYIHIIAMLIMCMGFTHMPSLIHPSYFL